MLMHWDSAFINLPVLSLKNNNNYTGRHQYFGIQSLIYQKGICSRFFGDSWLYPHFSFWYSHKRWITRMRDEGLKHLIHPGQMLTPSSNFWHPCRGASHLASSWPLVSLRSTAGYKYWMPPVFLRGQCVDDTLFRIAWKFTETINTFLADRNLPISLYIWTSPESKENPENQGDPNLP